MPDFLEGKHWYATWLTLLIQLLCIWSRKGSSSYEYYIHEVYCGCQQYSCNYSNYGRKQYLWRQSCL